MDHHAHSNNRRLFDWVMRRCAPLWWYTPSCGTQFHHVVPLVCCYAEYGAHMVQRNLLPTNSVCRDCSLRIWCTTNVLLQCVQQADNLKNSQFTIDHRYGASRSRAEIKALLISELAECGDHQEQLECMQDGSLGTSELRTAAKRQNTNILWAVARYWCVGCTCL